MRRKDLSHEELDKIIKLRQVGTSWLKIEHQIGIHRRTAKRAYDKWKRSQTRQELKDARKDVAARAFREHMDSVIRLTEGLATNLSLPSSPDEMEKNMEKNTEQFFSWLFRQDLLQRYISSETQVQIYLGDTGCFYIGDTQSYYREKELLFESLKVHTREEIPWKDVLDNRWGGARDKCAKIVPKLRRESSEVVNNFLNQEPQPNLLQSIKEGSGEGDPVERMVEAVRTAIWQDILRDKLDQEGPRFETVSQARGTAHVVCAKPRHGIQLAFTGDTSKGLAEQVTDICNLTYDNLRKGNMVRQLHDEVHNMKEAAEELREMLNPVKLVPMILRTECKLCPA